MRQGASSGALGLSVRFRTIGLQTPIITDKLQSYGAAKKEILPGVEHRQNKRLNNRAENSHQPTRQQEKLRRRLKTPQQAQRYKMTANEQREHLVSSWPQWQEIVLQAKCA